MSQGSNSNLMGVELANLYGVIDKDKVYGLNLAVPEHARAIIKPWDEREEVTMFADSGVDDQMIIHIPFTQNVRLKSILLKTGRGEFGPRHLRIYANHPTIVDFGDAENTKPQLNISILENEIGVIEYPLHVAAFTSVTSVSLFFNEAAGEEVSRVYYVGFKGDMRSLHKDANSKLEIPAQNAADSMISDSVSERVGGQRTTAR